MNTKKNIPLKCSQCKHFYITWDSDRPKGCKAYGFKSKEIPSMVVKKSSGQDCMMFEEKKAKKKKSFDDDSYW